MNVEIVFCKECKHRPKNLFILKDNPNATSRLDFPDEVCPLQCLDDNCCNRWESDYFFCTYGELDKPHLPKAKYKITKNPCKSCELSKYCNTESEKIISCVNYQERVAQTKADEIRGMSDEELANFLCDTSGMCSGCVAANFCKYGKIGFVEWLKQESKNND